MLDEGPSKDVYHQLEQLSKQNPVFVQSLQSIMTASHREDPGLAQQAAPTSPALLALLLASQIQPGSASLAGLAKKLESGTSVVELLQQALAQSTQTQAPAGQSQTTPAPPEPRPPLLPSPPAERPHIIPGGTGSDLAGLISRMTSTAAPQTPLVPPNTKSPQLQNMLYSAFQARISQQGEAEAPLPPTSPPKEDPPSPQTQPAQSVASYPVNLQTTYSVVAAPSYYQSPPPNHLQPSNLTHMLSQPPPPPPPSHNQHLASDHSWTAQAPLLVHAPLMAAHPQALWAAQPTLYHAQHAPQQQAGGGQKRKVETVEYPNYSDLEAPGLKRQKLCGN